MKQTKKINSKMHICRDVTKHTTDPHQGHAGKIAFLI